MEPSLSIFFHISDSWGWLSLSPIVNAPVMLHWSKLSWVFHIQKKGHRSHLNGRTVKELKIFNIPYRPCIAIASVSLGTINQNTSNVASPYDLVFFSAWWPQESQTSYMLSKCTERKLTVNKSKAESHFMSQPWKSLPVFWVLLLCPGAFVIHYWSRMS